MTLYGYARVSVREPEGKNLDQRFPLNLASRGSEPRRTEVPNGRGRVTPDVVPRF